eukprot:m.10192 g.10192  ORF g.10192 m.10192 type:complete len:334 (-) comp6540_c0_seq1:176-1177(-)
MDALPAEHSKVGADFIDVKTTSIRIGLREIADNDGPEAILSLLRQLSDIGQVSQQFYELRRQRVMESDLTIMYVLEDLDTKAIVGSATVVIEGKFIHAGSCVGHLEDVVVERGLRGRGFGKMLVKAVVEASRRSGCYKVLVDCDPDNLPFYEKCGFVRKGTCMSQYFDGPTASGILDTLKADVESFGENVSIRHLKKEDYNSEYLSVLAQLTTVGELDKELFDKRLEEAEENHTVFLVIEKVDTKQVVGAATLFIEQKFIHSVGFAGHVEDVVVDSCMRGKGLGKKLIKYVSDLSCKMGCYKCILDCDDANVPFYERCGYKKGHSTEYMALYF